MFNTISTTDLLSCVCAIMALLILIKGWSRKFSKPIKYAIAALILLTLFHDFTNFLEWGKIIYVLEIEYYLEILVPILWFLVLYFFAQNIMRQELESVANKWQSTFDGITDATCLMGIDKKIIKANKAMINLLDVSEDEIIGANCCKLLHGEYDPADKCPVDKMKLTKKRENLEIEKGDRCFNIIADPVKSDSGDIIGVVHIVQDITLRKRVEILRNTLIRDVSHTLKSPLAVVKMACGMMEKSLEKGDMENVKKSQQIAKHNADRAVRDVESILKMASLEGDAPMSVGGSISLKDLFEEIIESIPTHLENKDIELVMDIPPEADKVYGIENDLRMLFENLLENAYKFTEKGKISISTKLKESTIELQGDSPQERRRDKNII